MLHFQTTDMGKNSISIFSPINISLYLTEENNYKNKMACNKNKLECKVLEISGVINQS